MNLKGKVAYITGGSKGIGLGVAQSLLNNGMKVAISARSHSSLNEAKLKLRYDEGQLMTIVSNVADYSNEVNAVKEIEERWGGLDLVVANAGIGMFGPVHEFSCEDFDTIIKTNVYGVFHTLKSSVKLLEKSGGLYITISSLAGTNFFENGAVYNASKFAVVGFTQAAMLDLRKIGIRVTTIMPGSVATNFNGHIPGESDAWKIQPEDIGQLVVDLARMPERTLPSKIEVRPSFPGKK